MATCLDLRPLKALPSPRRPFQPTEGEIVHFSCRAAVWPLWIVALLKCELRIGLKQR